MAGTVTCSSAIHDIWPLNSAFTCDTLSCVQMWCSTDAQSLDRGPWPTQPQARPRARQGWTRAGPRTASRSRNLNGTSCTVGMTGSLGMWMHHHNYYNNQYAIKVSDQSTQALWISSILWWWDLNRQHYNFHKLWHILNIFVVPWHEMWWDVKWECKDFEKVEVHASVLSHSITDK